VLGLLERDRDVALSAEVVHLVRAHYLQHMGQARRIREIAMMQYEMLITHVRLFVEVVDVTPLC